jgi:hypothetical protein
MSDQMNHQKSTATAISDRVSSMRDRCFVPIKLIGRITPTR